MITTCHTLRVSFHLKNKAMCFKMRNFLIKVGNFFYLTPPPWKTICNYVPGATWFSYSEILTPLSYLFTSIQCVTSAVTGFYRLLLKATNIFCDRGIFADWRWKAYGLLYFSLFHHRLYLCQNFVPVY